MVFLVETAEYPHKTRRNWDSAVTGKYGSPRYNAACYFLGRLGVDKMYPARQISPAIRDRMAGAQRLLAFGGPRPAENR